MDKNENEARDPIFVSFNRSSEEVTCFFNSILSSLPSLWGCFDFLNGYLLEPAE